jgi:hypothetical protein
MRAAAVGWSGQAESFALPRPVATPPGQVPKPLAEPLLAGRHRPDDFEPRPLDDAPDHAT